MCCSVTQFYIRTVNGFTPEFEKEILDDIADMKKIHRSIRHILIVNS